MSQDQDVNQELYVLHNVPSQYVTIAPTSGGTCEETQRNITIHPRKLEKKRC